VKNNADWTDQVEGVLELTGDDTFRQQKRAELVEKVPTPPQQPVPPPPQPTTLVITEETSQKIDEIVTARVEMEVKRRAADISAEVERRVSQARWELQQSLERKYSEQIKSLEAKEVQ